MQTTIDFLDALKQHLGIQSDYALAKHLGMTRAAVSAYRHGKAKLPVLTCIEIAERLGIHPAQVIASIEAERSKYPAAVAAWLSVAELAANRRRPKAKKPSAYPGCRRISHAEQRAACQ